MAVLRKEKKDSFTVIDNAIFKNTKLSLKAKGLLCQMLSLPDGWEYSVKGLEMLSSDRYSAITSGLRELEEAGYFRREQLYDNGRFAGYEYVISEVPNSDFPFSENPISENTISENQTQLNTKELNTNKSITKDICSTDNGKSKRFSKPSIEDIRAYISEKGYSVDAERFYDYYESNGWKVGRSAMKDWKAAVRNWERSNYGKGKGKGTDFRASDKDTGSPNRRDRNTPPTGFKF